MSIDFLRAEQPKPFISNDLELVDGSGQEG